MSQEKPASIYSRKKALSIARARGKSSRSNGSLYRSENPLSFSLRTLCDPVINTRQLAEQQQQQQQLVDSFSGNYSSRRRARCPRGAVDYRYLCGSSAETRVFLETPVSCAATISEMKKYIYTRFVANFCANYGLLDCIYASDVEKYLNNAHAVSSLAGTLSLSNLSRHHSRVSKLYINKKNQLAVLGNPRISASINNCAFIDHKYLAAK